MIVGKQLGYHAKPIVVVDVDGYYRPLLAMLDHGVEQRFIKRSGRDLFHVAATAADAVEFLKRHGPGVPTPPAVDPARPPSAVE